MHFVFWLSLFSCCLELSAADWPQWRGPDRDGTWKESGLISKFPAGGLKPRWTAAVGFAYASPVVAGGRVFVNDLIVEGRAVHERVLCFKADSGENVWTVSHDSSPADWFFNPEQMRGSGGTPLVHRGRVYAPSMFGMFQCLDAATGKIIWEKDLAREYQVSNVALDSSPMAEGSTVILLFGGHPAATLVAFDLETGKEVWKALSEGPSWSSPVVVNAGGVRQLIVWTRQSVSSLNPANGQLYWREPIVSGGSPGNSAVSTPVFEGNRLLVSGMMFEMDGNRPAARLLWPESKSTLDRILSDTSTALLREGFVYGTRSGGMYVCLDAATGREKWQTNAVTELRRGAGVHAVVNGTNNFLFTDRGDLVIARLAPSGYEEISRAHLIEPTSILFESRFAWSAPAYANRCVYVRNDRELKCYSLERK